MQKEDEEVTEEVSERLITFDRELSFPAPFVPNLQKLLELKKRDLASILGQKDETPSK